MNIFWVVLSIFLVISFFLVFISLVLLGRTFKILIKELYKQESNINYIKGVIESYNKNEGKCKHQKLFEDYKEEI